MWDNTAELPLHLQLLLLWLWGACCSRGAAQLLPALMLYWNPLAYGFKNKSSVEGVLSAWHGLYRDCGSVLLPPQYKRGEGLAVLKRGPYQARSTVSDRT
jgi:hypothetical protein